ncbi:dTDP-4-amino-4,6-dideoxygalactose transaminase [Marinomonas sp.]|uniref:dTDP-4-amino-4,6-dideoxygalactose transaminase n=1 Tax=Marinomonas sp. TaxID=1904862 RepID=UPI003BADACF4
MIFFNIPAKTGKESVYIEQAISSNRLSGDGFFSKKCEAWFENKFNIVKGLMTPSCTAALELAAILTDIKQGDEVIVPSYTFVSSANPFVLRGAKIVFVDIRPDTMNIDENKIEEAITPRTRVIVPVHYAGVACEMDKIMELAKKYKLWVIEDAAQGVMSTYKGKALGTIGHFGAYSFHETKNYTSGGEGGLLAINAPDFKIRAEIIREKGTNRSQFFRGMVDKYSWVDIGSSYLPSEVQAAYLWAQLECVDEINEDRLNNWKIYYEGLKNLEDKGLLDIPVVPDCCEHNGHMFYIKVKNIDERSNLIEYLKKQNIMAVFHYVPLHSSTAGKKFGGFCGIDQYTTRESERLIRLPMYYGLKKTEIEKITNTIISFYS